MTAHLTTYEVKVKVKNGTKHYSSLLGMYVQETITKMFHQDARTPEQAMNKCKKHGRPISVHKADASRMYGIMENLPLIQEPYLTGNPYDNAVAMDEMIWAKRNKRIKNRGKDKNPLDK